MNPESIAYDRLMTAVRDCNHEESLRQAQIVYGFVFDRYTKSSGAEKEELKGELEKLSETIGSRHTSMDLSRAVEECKALLNTGGQTQ